jgi:hypothetical protein
MVFFISVNVTKYLKGYIGFVCFIDFVKEIGKMKIIKEKRYIQNGFLSVS